MNEFQVLFDDDDGKPFIMTQTLNYPADLLDDVGLNSF